MMRKETIGKCELYLGDCLDILPTLPDESVTACITDPPYPRKYIHLYWEIARELKRILVPGGSYVPIVPQYALAEIVTNVTQHLKYRWIIGMIQEEGRHPRMAMGIEVCFKPVLWWVKKSWPQGRGFIKDVFHNRQPDKIHHEWEQSLDWSDYCVHSFVPKEGGVVLDPVMGGGTTALSILRPENHPL